MEAAATGTLDGRGLPMVLFGHSKGGVSVLLTAGRYAGDDGVSQPAGVASVSAPSTCNSLTDQQQQSIAEHGFLLSPSSRTGQELRIGRIYLTEQLDDPHNHDLLKTAGRIACPVLIVHGELDPTVPAACAGQIAAACRGEPKVDIVTGADHVFNTPNPFPADAEVSPQLDAMLTGVGNFAVLCCEG